MDVRLGFEPLEARQLLATITVNTLVDENNGISVGGISLREAVAAAAPNDTIDFSVTGTINLTSTGSGHITINKSLTIQGPGAELLTIKAFDPDSNGNNDSDGRRVFYVSNGSSSLIDVTISGLTLTNGDPDISDEDNSLGGGAIHNEENLTLVACILTDNYAPGGGAIANASGTLSIVDCTISGNETKDGGAIIIDGGSLTISDSRINNNQATNSGGGILSRGRPVSITNSTISGNTAVEHGGGLYSYQGSLTLSNSTISANIADSNNDGFGRGGGIYKLGGGLNITNSTISGNASGENGGGIFSDSGQAASINHSTIFSNSVTNRSGNDGGGIRSLGATTLNHTIVAGNLKGAARDDVSGSFDALYSLIGDRRTSTVNNLDGSLIGTSASPISPLLGPLQNNGGPTVSHELLPNSPAINAGDPAASAGSGGIPLFDQRGTPNSRVLRGRIDMGSIEMPPPPPVLPGDYNSNNVVDAGDYVLWRKTFGSTVDAYSGADGNGNGIVNDDDFNVWRERFGQVLTAGTASEAERPDSVPQPIASRNSFASIGDAHAAAFDMLARAQVRSSPESVVGSRGALTVSDTSFDLLLMLGPSQQADQPETAFVFREYGVREASEDVESSVSPGVDSPISDF